MKNIFPPWQPGLAYPILAWFSFSFFRSSLRLFWFGFHWRDVCSAKMLLVLLAIVFGGRRYFGRMSKDRVRTRISRVRTTASTRTA